MKHAPSQYPRRVMVATRHEFEEGAVVADERGHYYRVLPTEPTFRKSWLYWVQPLTQWKDGSYHNKGERQIIDKQFLRAVPNGTA